MVNISGGWGRIRTWINKRIKIQDIGNIFVGEDSGNGTTGNYNSFLGYQAGYSNLAGHANSFMGGLAGYSNKSGYYNSFIGTLAGYTNRTGHSNDFMGYQAGYSNSTGHSNSFMGYGAGYSNTSGHSNSFLGYRAGYSNIAGYHNVFMGYQAGYSNAAGYHNVSIGYKAGYYETANLKLFIDAFARTDEADGRIKALIYGIFDAATANQLVRLNAILQLTEIKNGATQAGAGAAANEVWKTNGHASLPDNVLMIGV